MPAFPLEAFLASLPWVALGLVALLAVTFAVAVRQSRHSVIDTVWGLGFVVAAAVSWLLSAGHGDGGRRLLLLALVAVWGIRLAAHIGVRARGGHEDPRYVAMLSSAPGSRNGYALRRVYLPQGVVMFFVSLTLQVGMFARGPWAGWHCWAPCCGWSASSSRRSATGSWPGSRRIRLDAARSWTPGLWRYTRHPNYFGDAAVWAGLFLVAADSWPGVLTVLSPALMIWTLAGKTGKPLTEKAMSARPGYKEYVESTSGFIPRPPRRRKTRSRHQGHESPAPTTPADTEMQAAGRGWRPKPSDRFYRVHHPDRTGAALAVPDPGHRHRAGTSARGGPARLVPGHLLPAPHPRERAPSSPSHISAISTSPSPSCCCGGTTGPRCAS